MLSSLKAKSSLKELDLQYNDLGNVEEKVRCLNAKLPSLRYCSFYLVLVNVVGWYEYPLDPRKIVVRTLIRPIHSVKCSGILPVGHFVTGTSECLCTSDRL